jgi:hypothetical protein
MWPWDQGSLHILIWDPDSVLCLPQLRPAPSFAFPRHDSAASTSASPSAGRASPLVPAPRRLVDREQSGGGELPTAPPTPAACGSPLGDALPLLLASRAQYPLKSRTKSHPSLCSCARLACARCPAPASRLGLCTPRRRPVPAPRGSRLSAPSTLHLRTCA